MPPQIEPVINKISGRLSEAMLQYMLLSGKRLKDITEKDLREYQYSAEYLDDINGDIKKINKVLNKAHKANLQDINSLFKTVTAEVYSTGKEMAEHKSTRLSPLSTYRQEASPLLRQVMSNYSTMAKSTSVNTDYKKTIRNYINRLTMGDEDYAPVAMKKAIRELTAQGITTIDYQSGRSMRMDSAVRNSLMSEYTNIVQEVQNKLGEEIGADAVEISLHEHAAVDHEPIQGRVFTNEEFEKLQNGEEARDVDIEKYEAGESDYLGGTFQTDRPIGLWNCRHICFPFILGVSIPSATREELEAIKERNEDGIEFDGKEYTLYEAEQHQRQLEAQMRAERENINLYKEVRETSPQAEHEYQKHKARLAELRNEYKELGAALEPKAIRMKWDRSYVPKGSTGGQVYQPPAPPPSFTEPDDKLISKGLIVSKNQNIHINLTDKDIEDIERNARPIKGEAWGSAIRGNEKAEAFAYVNSSVYQPLNYATDGLHYDYQSKITRENLERAIGQRIHAQEQIKNVIASRQEMPYFLRGEELPKEIFDKMIADNQRDLTGITALTASKDHNDNWIKNMFEGGADEDYVKVRFHFFRDDALEKTAGLVSQNDLNNKNNDFKRPDEIAIGATKFFIDKTEKNTLFGFPIYDVWGRVK